MAIHLGAAYVDIVPSTRGLGRELSTGLVSEVSAAGDKAGRGFGSRFASAVGGVVSATASAVGATAGGLFAASLTKGFGRLKAIDAAEFKLKGLGHSAAGVEEIMDSALASVEGTAFGLGEAATIAASAVAAGIEPGKELTRYLSLVGDTATIAGGSLEEIGGIVNKVTTGQRAYRRELQQLADSGLPVFDWLQEKLGATGAEFDRMVADGAVSSELLLQVIEENIGGAALIAGDSWSGMVANIGAAMGRLGEKILLPFFNAFKEIAPAVINLFDELGKRVATAMSGLETSEAFRAFVDTLSNLDLNKIITQLSEFAPLVATIAGFIGASGLGGFARLVPGLGGFAAAINPVVAAVAALALSLPDVREALANVGREIGPVIEKIAAKLVPIFMNVADLAAEVLPGAIDVFGTVAVVVLETVSGLLGIVEPLTRFLADHAEIVKVVAVSYGIWKAAMISSAAWGRFQRGLEGASGKMSAFGASAGKFAALTGAVALGAYAWDQWNAPAKRAADNLKDLETRALNLGGAVDALRSKLADTWAGLDGGFKTGGLYDLKTVMDDIGVSSSDLAGALERGGDELAAIQRAVVDTQGAWAAAAIVKDLGEWHEQGLKAAETERLLTETRRDLGLETDEASGKFEKYTGVLGFVESAGKRVGEAFRASADEAKALAEEIDKAGVKAGEAFRSSFDILSADIEGPKDIATFYREAVADAAKFGEDYRTAIAAGYQPSLIARLLAAGPEQAGELLGILAANTSTAFVEMVNEGEQAISEMSAFATEAARLTQMAISETGAEGQRMSQLLETAIEISTIQMEWGTTISIETLATYTKRSVDEVSEAARLFGLEVYSLRDKINGIIGLMNVGLGMVRAFNLLPIRPPMLPEFHTGGIVGAGVSGDEAIVKVMRGEWILTPEQVGRLTGAGAAAAAPKVSLEVGGHAVTERDLVVVVRDGINRMQATSSAPVLPGVSG